MNTITKSEYVLKAETVLAKTHGVCRVCGWGEPPPLPYYQNGWSLNEISKSDLEFTTPAEIRTILDGLEKAGIEYSHILIGHEPQKAVKRLQIPKVVRQSFWKVLKVLALITAGLAVAIAGVMVLGVILQLVAVLVAVMAFPALLFSDPVVIVVLKDENQTWLEIARYYE